MSRFLSVVSMRLSLFFLLVCLLLPALAFAQEDGQSPASETEASDSDASANGAREEKTNDTGSTEAEPAGPDPARTESAIAFDPAAVGLPDLPQPMRSADDFQKTLALIDARLAELTAALEAAEALVADGVEPRGGAGDGAMDRAEAEAMPADETDAEASPSAASPGPNAVPADARASGTIQARIDVLQELRLVVQRRATLHERLKEREEAVAREQDQPADEGLAGLDQGPPFLVSLLDQARAELALKQAVEDVAETRIETATRRHGAAERALAAAVRERRAARDRLAAAENLPDAEREALAQELELARLNALLARQRLAAAQSALELARSEHRLVEAEQARLVERVSALEGQVVLPRDALAQRLDELSADEEVLSAEIERLQQVGDEIEAELYRAQRQLAEGRTDRPALEEWVATRQAQLDAARTGVDSLSAALANLAQTRALWELRYQFMNDPEALDLAESLTRIANDLTFARAAKDDIEARLSALRSIQLAQTRRLRDPALSESVREALAARSEAQDRLEEHGRELLETQDALLSLLEGMRYQLQGVVEQNTLSLQLLQTQEAIAQWWDSELLEIDDQSVLVRDVVVAVAVFAVVLFVVSLIQIAARRAVKRRKARSPTAEAGDLRLALSAIAGNTSQVFVLVAAFYVAMMVSGLASPTVKDWLWTLLVIVFYAQLGIWANAAMVDYFNRRRTRQEMRDPSTVTGYGLLMFFLRVGIWITVVVSLLAYFEYPVAGLVGALGVGSLAIAFAVQTILGDVFSSMAIILDKPFRVGDFIMSGQTLGVIEHIGVKTTRIRSLSGEQVVLSNSDLLSSRIHNFKNFRERRIATRVGVVYQTPRALLERIPGMLREAVEEQPNARFDRAHFAEFGDFALTFELVYYVRSPDYTIYMDTQQGINLGIHRRFEEAGVSFAYPTQELILRRAPALSS
jgi:small-conductance mechanosensitive channel